MPRSSTLVAFQGGQLQGDESLLGFAAYLLWWLARGSAYGIRLCLQGQLRVPVEGWRIIVGRARTPLPLIGYIVLTLVCLFAVLFSLMQMLFILF